MQSIFLTPTTFEEAIRTAVAVLESGGLVVYPTETLYGVAADATNPEAVGRLLAFKDRPAGKPISVLVADLSIAEVYVDLNPTARRLAATFLPGPVTLVCWDRGLVDPRLPSELGGLGIRVSSHPFATALAAAYGKPVTATSANASGRARPYTIQTMLSGLSDHQKGLLTLVVDAGPLPRREPSTVIDTLSGTQELLRVGELAEAIDEGRYSTSEEDTLRIAGELMEALRHALPEKAVVFALEGEMGAGKTRFAQGVARALGIEAVVNSPTYTVMKEYESSHPSPLRLIHMDCWRLETVKADEFGLDHYLQPGTVAVIEWATPLLPYLHSKLPELAGSRVIMEPTGENSRLIRLGEL